MTQIYTTDNSSPLLQHTCIRLTSDA